MPCGGVRRLEVSCKLRVNGTVPAIAAFTAPRDVRDRGCLTILNAVLTLVLGVEVPQRVGWGDCVGDFGSMSLGVK